MMDMEAIRSLAPAELRGGQFDKHLLKEYVETRATPGAEPLDFALCGQPDIPQAPFFLEANRFAVLDLMQAIAEDRQPVSNVWTARATLEMIYGIYASSLGRSAIPFPLRDRVNPLEHVLAKP